MTEHKCSPIGEQKDRVAWMDVSRGIAIVLVIAFHSVSEVDKQIGLPQWLVILNNIVAPARMPLMVFLSGLLLTKSLKRPSLQYLRGKFSRILWPYFIWSLLLFGLLVVSGTGDYAFGVNMIVKSATIAPIDHLWFLRDLFLFYLISLCVCRLSPKFLLLGALVVLLLIGSLNSEQLSRSAYLYFFFVIGWVVSSFRPRFVSFVTNNKVSYVYAGISLLIMPLVIAFGDIRYDVVVLPVVACLALSVLRLAMVFGRSGRVLSFIGKNSLIYYLVHWPVLLVLVRIFSESASLIDSFWVFVAVFCASFAACTVAVFAGRSYGPLCFLFSFTWPRRLAPTPVS